MATGAEIESYIRKITSGQWFIQTKSNDPTRKLLAMRYPTLKELQLCDFYKEYYIEKNKDILMSTREAESKAFIHGVWNPTYDDKLQSLITQTQYLEDQIEEFDIKSKKVIAFRSRSRTARRELVRLTDYLERLAFRKSSVFSNTLEYNAEKHRIYRIIGLVTEHIDGKPVWKDGNIELEEDFNLLDILSQSYLQYCEIDIRQIREVARSNYWRYRWAVGKNNVKLLFGRDIRDLSVAQQELVFWSEIYESAIEAYEPPISSIIENDEKFDEWLAKKGEDGDRERERRFYKFDEFKGNENFVIVNGYYDNEGYWQSYTQEEKDKRASMIYGNNSPNIRRMQRQAIGRIDKHGGAPVKEQHIRQGYFKVLGWDRIPEK